MKYLFYTALIIVVIGCDDSIKITTGLEGQVSYAAGDCMPTIGARTREYHPYTGELVFIAKSALNNLGEESFENLKAHSIKRFIINGHLSTSLPVDTYVVMPTSMNAYSEEYFAVVTEGSVTKKDFSFFKCLSY